MGLTQLVFFHPKLEPIQHTYWFMMQVGMSLGLLTTYPANWWLVKKGIKYGMQGNGLQRFWFSTSFRSVDPE